METRVPFLNISDKQYMLIGLTWGFIFAAIFQFYKYFETVQNSIVFTFFNGTFLLNAVIGMVVGFIVSYFGLRYLNK